MSLDPSEHAVLLREINADLPCEVEWKVGARRYVQSYFAKYSREGVERYAMSKPLGGVPNFGPIDLAIEEAAELLFNFANTLRLLRLPGGSRVLDVACGGGWLAHFLARMNYDAYGFDLNADFVEIARRRLAADPLLSGLAGTLDKRLFALDVEAEPLPTSLHGAFDAAILESCLHHFVDPITALSHISDGLVEGGVVVVLEGENRRGPLREEYLAVMREWHTLERPYPRHLLERVYHTAGLPHFEFLGALNGWFSVCDPSSVRATEWLLEAAEARNFSVCAKTPEALQRVLPGYKARLPTPLPQVAAKPPQAMLASQLQDAQSALRDAQSALRDAQDALEATRNSRTMRLAQTLKNLLRRG